MNVRGERILIFGDSTSHFGSDAGPEIWDVDRGSQRSGTPGDLLASMLAEHGAEAVRVNARVSRSASNFFGRENTQALFESDAQFKPSIVFVLLGTNDIGLNQVTNGSNMAAIRKAYEAMGAKVYGIGPWSYVNPSLNTQAEPVAAMMKGVFGLRYIDGRPLSVQVGRSSDGVHFGGVAAKQTAENMLAAIDSKLALPTASLGMVAVTLGAVIGGFLLYRKYGRAPQLKGLAAKNKQLRGKDPNQAKRELFELLKTNDPHDRSVARDLAIESGLVREGEIVSIRAAPEGFGPQVYIVKTATGEEFGTTDAMFDHRKQIEQGKPLTLAFVVGREPWLGNKRQLHPARMLDVHANGSVPIWPDSLYKKWINAWWPNDFSPPLEGLRGSQKQLPPGSAFLVEDAAKAVTKSKRFGERKVFISDVHEELIRANPEIKISLDDFKRELVRMHRDGNVVLNRADLVAAMPTGKVNASEARADGATFHFVTLDGLGGASTKKPRASKETKTKRKALEAERQQLFSAMSYAGVKPADVTRYHARVDAINDELKQLDSPKQLDGAYCNPNQSPEAFKRCTARAKRGLAGKEPTFSPHEKELEALILDPDPASMAVAEDFAMQHGIKLSLFTNKYGTESWSNIGFIRLEDPKDIRGDRVMWTFTRPEKTSDGTFASMCEGRVNVLQDGERVGNEDGDITKRVHFVHNFEGSDDFCARAITAEAWAVAKEFRRKKFRGEKLTPSDIKRVMNQNNSEPADLFGLGKALGKLSSSRSSLGKPQDDARDEAISAAIDAAGNANGLLGFTPESESMSETKYGRFSELLRDPDPDALDIAEDMALEDNMRLSIFSSTPDSRHKGYFSLAPGYRQLESKWSTYYRRTQDPNANCEIGLEQYVDGDRLIWDGEEFNEIDSIALVKLSDERGTPEQCRRRAAQEAWAIGKSMKQALAELPEDMNGRSSVRRNVAMRAVERAIGRKRDNEPADLFGLGKALGNTPKEILVEHERLNDKEGLFGASLKGSNDEAFRTRMRDLVRDPDPASMAIAEDLALENNVKLSRWSSDEFVEGQSVEGIFEVEEPEDGDDYGTAVVWHVDTNDVAYGFCRSDFLIHINGQQVTWEHLTPEQRDKLALPKHVRSWFRLAHGQHKAKTEEACVREGARAAWQIATGLKKLKATPLDEDDRLEQARKLAVDALEYDRESPEGLFGTKKPPGTVELKLKDKERGHVWLTLRNGVVVGAMGSDPKRYIGLTEQRARRVARYG